MADEDQNKDDQNQDQDSDNQNQGDSSQDQNKEKEFKDDGAEPQGGVSQDQNKEDENKDDDEVDPEDEKTIGKIVNKTVAPLQDQLFKSTVESELNNIYAQNPDWKKFDVKIRRFVNHPSRAGLIKQGLPVKTVVLEAIEPHLAAVNAKKSQEADAKANAAKDGGNQNRPVETQGKLPDFANMSTADIDKTVEQVKSGTYKLPTQ